MKLPARWGQGLWRAAALSLSLSLPLNAGWGTPPLSTTLAPLEDANLDRAAAKSPQAPVPRYALAMHGEPLSPPDFAAFPYVNPDAPKGGTLRQAVVGSFDSLNPFLVRGRVPAELVGLVYLPLMSRAWDEPFTLYGLIAATVTVPEDRSWVEFALRPEARWQDGQPVTTADVLFSWNFLRQHGRPNHRLYYNRVTAATQPAPDRVRFTFAANPDGRIDRELPLILALMPVLPEHGPTAAGPAGPGFRETFLMPPLGSGPYRVAAVEPGRRLVLERDPQFWGRDLPVMRGLHNVDRRIFDFYRDEAVALEAFKAGEADIRVERDPARWATAYDIPARQDGRLRLESLPHGRPEPLQALIFNTRRPVFADRAVRRALARGLDFAWINRTFLHGGARRSASYFPNAELAATGLPDPAEQALLTPLAAHLPPEVLTQPWTLAEPDPPGPVGLRPALRQAAAELAAAGWPIRQGQRVQAETGLPLAFEILLLTPNQERIVLEYARALERIGVRVRVRTVDSAQFQARLDAFDYDMVLHGWGMSLSPGNEQAFYFGSPAAGQNGSRNYAGIRSPAVDALISGLVSAPDRAGLVAHARALDRVLLWESLVIPLYHLGEDRIASWSWIGRPAVTPLYGAILDSWWQESPSRPRPESHTRQK